MSDNLVILISTVANIFRTFNAPLRMHFAIFFKVFDYLHNSVVQKIFSKYHIFMITLYFFAVFISGVEHCSIHIKKILVSKYKFQFKFQKIDLHNNLERTVNRN